MNRFFYCCLAFVLTLVLISSTTSPSFALEPEEVLVVANMNTSQSKGIADYYMEKRQIPKKNIVLLFITNKETCSREDYVKKAVPPIRRALDANPDIRAIVTVFGVPLRISSPGTTPEEQSKLAILKSKKTKLEELLAKNEIDDPENKKKTKKALSALKNKINRLSKQLDKGASFDSELMLVKKKNYALNMWLPNPFFLGYSNQKVALKKSEVMMTSRLDAANAKIVKRIINDSIEAEQEGLKGSAYFDARWKNPGKKKVAGYGLYDRSIHRAAKSLSEKTQMNVIFNDVGSLFQKGESPDTALYCGWYSLAKYVDAFTWQKGSVGYHIASSECATLRNENSQVWCKKMLDYGIAATIGPVGEPYVQSFPMPEIFFKFLAEGYLNLAESYLISLPYLSWKMVLVGDPLYRVNLKDYKKDGPDYGS